MNRNIRCTLRAGVCLLLSLLLCVSGLAGCAQFGDIASGIAATGEYPVTVGETTINAKPQKVVVLSASLADVVLALGYDTQLAAGDNSCTQTSLRSLTKIDGTDPQAVLSVSPDLVLAETMTAEMSSVLSSSGVTALLVSPATDREDFERLYSQVGAALGGTTTGYEHGIAQAQDVFTTLDDINRIVPSEKITTACYLYDLEGSAVTGDMLASTVMRYAGVTNVFSSVSGGTYEFESLRVGNPDFIFCAPGVKDRLLADSRFAELQAVQNSNVYELDSSYMEWQGRTVVTAAYEISAAAFPELLEESSSEPEDPAETIESQVSSIMESSALEEDTTNYSTLQQGDQNEDVLKMQTRLAELGYLDVEYDGHFGEYTADCLKKFQKANELEETGIADAETQRKLYAKSAKAAE